jgi:hypothetical protein
MEFNPNFTYTIGCNSQEKCLSYKLQQLLTYAMSELNSWRFNNGCLYLNVKQLKYKLCPNVMLHFQIARYGYVYLDTVVPDINCQISMSFVSNYNKVVRELISVAIGQM